MESSQTHAAEIESEDQKLLNLDKIAECQLLSPLDKLNEQAENQPRCPTKPEPTPAMLSPPINCQTARQSSPRAKQEIKVIFSSEYINCAGHVHSERQSTQFMSSQNSLTRSQLHTEVFKMDASISQEPEGQKVEGGPAEAFFSIERGKKELEQQLARLLRKQNKRAFAKKMGDKRPQVQSKQPAI